MPLARNHPISANQLLASGSRNLPMRKAGVSKSLPHSDLRPARSDCPKCAGPRSTIWRRTLPFDYLLHHLRVRARSRKPHGGFRQKQTLSLKIRNDRVCAGCRMAGSGREWARAVCRLSGTLAAHLMTEVGGVRPLIPAPSSVSPVPPPRSLGRNTALLKATLAAALPSASTDEDGDEDVSFLYRHSLSSISASHCPFCETTVLISGGLDDVAKKIAFWRSTFIGFFVRLRNWSTEDRFSKCDRDHLPSEIG